jgi:hypothetical protein
MCSRWTEDVQQPTCVSTAPLGWVVSCCSTRGPHAAPDGQDMAAARYASTIDPTIDGQTFCVRRFSRTHFQFKYSATARAVATAHFRSLC